MNIRLITAALGALIALLGLCMLSSLFWSLHYQDGLYFRWAAVSVCAIAVGACLFFALREPHTEFGARDAFVVVTGGWVTSGVLGAVPFMACGVLPSFTDAIFESVSGFTTTGATVLADVETVPRSVLFWRSLTHWLGGMGIIVLSVAILPLLGVGGMAMFKAEVPSPVVDKLKPTVAATAKALWKVYLILSAAETLLLVLAGMELFDAICHTFGTLATGGFSTKNLSIGHYESPLIHLIIIVFMLMAGVNFTLHYQAMNLNFSSYGRSQEFRLYLIIFLGSTAFIFWNIYRLPNGALFASLDQAAFQTASIMTTTGYGTADWEQWPWACQWLLLSLMFMGGCAGSTGGGMKCMRLVIVAKHILRELKLLLHPRAVIALKMDRAVVHNSIVNGILAFAALFVAVWSLSTALLVAMDLDVITAVGATTATLSNIGPGLNKVGAMDHYGWLSQPAKWLLSFNMLIGRLELFTVLILFVPDFWKK